MSECWRLCVIVARGTHGGPRYFLRPYVILVVSANPGAANANVGGVQAACAAGMRSSAVLLMYRHRYAREEASGKRIYRGKVSGRQTCITGIGDNHRHGITPGM